MSHFQYLEIKIYLGNHKPLHWLFFKGNEYWKDIKGFEGLYQVSTNGRIKNLRTKKLLKIFPVKKGYFLAYLYKLNEPRKVISIHRLIALNFIPNPENKDQVNHKKGKSNFKNNLEWMTCVENINHAIENNLRPRDINLRIQDKFSKLDLIRIRNMFSLGFKNPDIAKEYKCHHSTISKIRTGTNYAVK